MNALTDLVFTLAAVACGLAVMIENRYLQAQNRALMGAMVVNALQQSIEAKNQLRVRPAAEPEQSDSDTEPDAEAAQEPAAGATTAGTENIAIPRFLPHVQHVRVQMARD